MQFKNHKGKHTAETSNKNNNNADRWILESDWKQGNNKKQKLQKTYSN